MYYHQLLGNTSIKYREHKYVLDTDRAHLRICKLGVQWRATLQDKQMVLIG